MSQLWEIINDVIADANLILEVLDARDPNGTRNKRLEKLVIAEPDKKLVLILNKIDLVPSDVVEQWRKLLQSEFPVIAISAARKFERTLRFLRKKILSYAPSLPAYVGIVGYTNVGKSTIINGLKGIKTVGTSPQAGFTRGKQYINLSKNIRLIDSPGIIPIEGDEIEKALKAVITPEKVTNVDAVVKEIMNRVGNVVLSKFYSVQFAELDEFLEKLAKRRGKLLPGGVPDVYEAAKIVIRDFQRGQILYYTLPEK
ncbi:MAG: 50S ribosome-binding GTPase [Candidatus Helarchaeota archaeon]|nr:50S ribosome-binding GTPase [Candidatus Helarchaeota archaeon]